MSGEFCDMPFFIADIIINSINENFDCKRLKMAIDTSDVKRYNLVITGSVGAGKSTISQLVSTILKKCCKHVITYPEFISVNFNNRPIGQDIFEMCMNKKISSSTFQNFVIDIWKTLFTENEYADLKDTLTINVFERLPHDAIFCFSKEQVGKNMTEEEYQTILKKYTSLKENFQIPTYENCTLARVSNDSDICNTIAEILNIIMNDILSGTVSTRVIGLEVSADKYKQRIEQRGRECEEKYEDTTLIHYNNYYDKLYKEISVSNRNVELSSL